MQKVNNQQDFYQITSKSRFQQCPWVKKSFLLGEEVFSFWVRKFLLWVENYFPCSQRKKQKNKIYFQPTCEVAWFNIKWWSQKDFSAGSVWLRHGLLIYGTCQKLSNLLKNYLCNNGKTTHGTMQSLILERFVSQNSFSQQKFCQPINYTLMCQKKWGLYWIRIFLIQYCA